MTVYVTAIGTASEWMEASRLEALERKGSSWKKTDTQSHHAVAGAAHLSAPSRARTHGDVSAIRHHNKQHRRYYYGKSTHPHTGRLRRTRYANDEREKKSRNIRAPTGGRDDDASGTETRNGTVHCERNRSSRRRPPQEQRASGRDVTSPQVMRRADDGAGALRPSRGGAVNYDGPVLASSETFAVALTVSEPSHDRCGPRS
ncbi:hypothetical protein MTO96_017164 [Rhipicephalus appendiculatus]